MKTLRLALAQINTTVGDLEGNKNLILNAIHLAKKMGVDWVVFPELAITGYPPEDLLLRPQFVEDNLVCLSEITQETEGITAVVGFVDLCKGGVTPPLHNAAAILHDGKHIASYHKICLPNYGVFDERRYFTPGNEIPLFHWNGIKIGVNVCEDIWNPNVCQVQARKGANLVINLSSSPYHSGKGRERQALISERAKENGVIVAFVNLVGGQDELVFDGQSLLFDRNGKLIEQGNQFDEDLILWDLHISTNQEASRALHTLPTRGQGSKKHEERRSPWKTSIIPLKKIHESHDSLPPISPRKVNRLEPLEEIYEALLLGTRDYIRKNGFQKVVLGLSGGIDSSLTAVIAVDALKRENVIGVFMPSPYSSRESEEDAMELAKRLGIRSLSISISDAFLTYRKMLADPFKGLKEDITEENLQARIRGNILMALSNKFGWLVLTTGNKSEVSMGYCTLYGDTAGGFAVLKDVPKTLVFHLAKYRNTRDQEIIPKRVMEKPPTAELKPNQKDEDTLPPYKILDPILEAYVEDDKEVDEIVSMGYDRETVLRVVKMVDQNEYKRRQAPPGVKITPKAFGKDRRLPITNRYRRK